MMCKVVSHNEKIDEQDPVLLNVEDNERVRKHLRKIRSQYLGNIKK